MRGALLALGLAFGLAACAPCRSKSDCDQGERCDLESGDCVLGCTTDSTCAASARCNLELGRCEPRTRPPLFPPDDAAVTDTGTSTAADAALGD